MTTVWRAAIVAALALALCGCTSHGLSLREAISSEMMMSAYEEPSESDGNETIPMYTVKSKTDRRKAKVAFQNALGTTGQENIEGFKNDLMPRFCPDGPETGPKVNRAFKQILHSIGMTPKDLGFQRDYRLTIFGCYVKNDMMDESSQKVFKNLKKRHLRKLALGPYVLMLPTEIPERSTGFAPGYTGDGLFSAVIDVPDTEPEEKYLNYVDQGFVTPPTNQAGCMNCYAWAAMNVLSARCFLDTKSLFELSVMPYMTCHRVYSTQADRAGSPLCTGDPGGTPTTFRDIALFAAANGTVPIQESPFELDQTPPLDDQQVEALCQPQTSVCNLGDRNAGVMLYSYGKTVTDNMMMQALRQYGPGSVAIQAYPLMATFQTKPFTPFHVYGSDPDDNSSPAALADRSWKSINHAVTLVGYDISDPDNRFWILKNSWGSDFAYQGYFFVAMGGDLSDPNCPGNLCMNQMFQAFKPHSMRLNRKSNYRSFEIKSPENPFTEFESEGNED